MDRGRLVEHRAIAAGGETVTLALELADESEGLAARLEAIEGVEDVTVENLTAIFCAPSGAVFRRDLLARLVGEGVSVSGLAERRLGLRDIYREVARSDEGQP